MEKTFPPSVPFLSLCKIIQFSYHGEIRCSRKGERAGEHLLGCSCSFFSWRSLDHFGFKLYHRPRHLHSAHAQASSLGLFYGLETKLQLRGSFTGYCLSCIYFFMKQIFWYHHLQNMGKMEKRQVYWGFKPNALLPNHLFLFPYEGT